MSDSTRRGFLVLAGAGAATVGAAVAAPAATARPTGTAVPAHHSSGPLVAYVSDVRHGEVSLMVGEHEVVVRDRDLVARLVHAASKQKA